MRVGAAGRKPALAPPLVRRAVAAVLDGEATGPAAVSVTFLPASRMRALNRRSLGHDRITDVVAFRLVHDGAVRILENRRAFPRAYVTHDVRSVRRAEDGEAALEAEGAAERRTAFLRGPLPAGLGPSERASTPARIEELDARRVRLSARLDAPGLLVLSDLCAPGWTARVDGAEQRVLEVDGLLRGVALPAGGHEVELTYRPGWIVPGLALLAAGLAALAFLLRPSRRARAAEAAVE